MGRARRRITDPCLDTGTRTGTTDLVGDREHGFLCSPNQLVGSSPLNPLGRTHRAAITALKYFIMECMGAESSIFVRHET
jgi:hypothetical protein